MSRSSQGKNFTVSQANFDGPFEALVSLIEKRKLHISEISLREITDEFIQYVKQKELELKDVSDFVVVAATLMLLKSRSLLPGLPLSPEEEQDISDLQDRLEMYSLFQTLGQRIQKMFGQNILYKTVAKRKQKIVFSPDPSIKVKNISLLAKELIESAPIVEERPEKKVAKQKSLKEITSNIKDRINRYVQTTFADITAGKDRKEKSASFLAVLELFRQGDILLSQRETFGSIDVSSSKTAVPYYGGDEK